MECHFEGKTIMWCYKSADDDWYPSYSNSLVRVSIGEFDRYDDDERLWHVTASGNDDYSVQMVYTNENKALCDFQSLLGLDKVNYHDVTSLSGEHSLC